MQTLSEITREELAARQRSFEFERLTNRAATLRATIARLSTGVDTSALEQMRALVPQVPDDLVTHGLQGGYSARGLLGQIVTHALEDLGFREDRRLAELDAAHKELTQIEEALTAFQ